MGIRSLTAATWVLVLFTAALARAQTAAATAAQAPDDGLRADIEKMLEGTGASKLGTQMASMVTQQVFAAIKRAQPSIPDRGIEVVQQTLDAEFAKAWDGPDGLTEQIVTIYSKHFTHDEIRALLAFYSTDVGKKAISITPGVIQECALAGQQWAAKQMPRIEQIIEAKLKAEGFIK